MATTVEIDEETESRLTELQIAIRRETGQTVTQRELLGRLVERAPEAELIDSFRVDADIQLCDEGMTRLLAEPTETDDFENELL